MIPLHLAYWFTFLWLNYRKENCYSQAIPLINDKDEEYSNNTTPLVRDVIKNEDSSNNTNLTFQTIVPLFKKIRFYCFNLALVLISNFFKINC